LNQAYSLFNTKLSKIFGGRIKKVKKKKGVWRLQYGFIFNPEQGLFFAMLISCSHYSDGRFYMLPFW